MVSEPEMHRSSGGGGRGGHGDGGGGGDNGVDGDGDDLHHSFMRLIFTPI